jgi:ribosomal protein L21E
MSFAIDENKVEELLRTSDPKYTVSIVAIEPTIENQTPHYGYMGVSGTVYVDHATVSKEARGHLLTIREKIEKSGTRLQGATELTEEIEAMRGRSR